MLVPMAVLAPDNIYYHAYMSPLSTLFGAATMDQLGLTQAVRPLSCVLGCHTLPMVCVTWAGGGMPHNNVLFCERATPCLLKEG